MKTPLALIATAALAGCQQPVGPDSVGPRPVAHARAGLRRSARCKAGALIVTRDAAPFSYSDGAEAKRAANGFCGPKGVDSSPEDNFREDAWVFPGGCV